MLTKKGILESRFFKPETEDLECIIGCASKILSSFFRKNYPALEIIPRRNLF
jgi:hypothetical protein